MAPHIFKKIGSAVKPKLREKYEEVKVVRREKQERRKQIESAYMDTLHKERIKQARRRAKKEAKQERPGFFSGIGSGMQHLRDNLQNQPPVEFPKLQEGKRPKAPKPVFRV